MDKTLILNYINSVAGKYPILSIALHLMVIALTILLFIPAFKQKRFMFNGVLALLCTSVAVIASINGNYFNGGFFVILLGFVFIEFFRRRNEIETVFFGRHTWGENVKNAFCFAMILLGLLYPHFVNVSPVLFIFLSPLGIIPCPTLTVVMGLLNLFYPRVSKGVYTAATLMALFYGITGVFLLQVYMDIPLMLIALYSFYNLRFLFVKRTKEKAIVAEDINMQNPAHK